MKLHLAFAMALVSGFLFAGMKINGTLELHDSYVETSPESLIYTEEIVQSVLADGTIVLISGGPYYPLFPKGKASKPTGNFGLAISRPTPTEVKYRFIQWDRFGVKPGPIGGGYRSTFETEGWIKTSEAQRIFFTHGDVSEKSKTPSFQYMLLIKLDKVENCDDSSTCLVR